jgi:hypothetical protein
MLSVSTDKLVALSGVASHFAKLTGFTYIAGLWNIHVEGQLLWYCAPPKPRPTDFCAPTWSWASISTPIKSRACTDYSQSILRIRVKKATTTLAGSEPFGQVGSGYIRLVSRSLFPVRMQVVSPLYSPRTNLLIQGGPQEATPSQIEFYPDYVLPEDEDTVFYGMLVARTECFIYGLVLKSTRDAAFERVGLLFCNIRSDEKNTTFDEQVESAVRNYPHDIERCLPAGLDETGKELVEITII